MSAGDLHASVSLFFHEGGIRADAARIVANARRKRSGANSLFVALISITILSVCVSLVPFPGNKFEPWLCVASGLIFAVVAGTFGSLIGCIRKQGRIIKQNRTAALPSFLSNEDMQRLARRHRFIAVVYKLLMVPAVLVSLAIIGLAIKWRIWQVGGESALLVFLLLGLLKARRRGAGLVDFCLAHEFGFAHRLMGVQLRNLPPIPLLYDVPPHRLWAKDVMLGLYGKRHVLLLTCTQDFTPAIARRRTYVHQTVVFTPSDFAARESARDQIPAFRQPFRDSEAPAGAASEEAVVEGVPGFLAVYWPGVEWPHEEYEQRLDQAVLYIKAWERSTSRGD